MSAEEATSLAEAAPSAGAVSDVIDKRRMLLWIQLVMAAAAGGLAAPARAHLTRPPSVRHLLDAAAPVALSEGTCPGAIAE